MLMLVMVIFFACYGPDVSADVTVAIRTNARSQLYDEFESMNDTQNFLLFLPRNISAENCYNIEALDFGLYNETSSGSSGDMLLDRVQQFSRVTMLLHSTLNPLLYFIFSRDFQNAFIKMCTSCKTKIASLLF